MNQELPLTVTGAANTSVAISPQAIEQRDEAVSTAQAITGVYDDETQSLALTSLADLKRMRIQMEDTRQLVKRPVLDLGKLIDKTAQEFVTDITREEARLDSLVTRHQKQLRAKAAKAEEERQIEEARQRREEEARLAEIKRKEEEAAEALRKAQEAGKKAEADKAAADLETARVAAEELEEQQLAAEMQREMEVPAVVNLIGSDVWEFEVVDVAAFVKTFPEYCKIEVKRRDVLEAIKAGKFDRQLPPNTKPVNTDNVLNETTIRTAPGLRIYKEVKVRH